MCINNKTAVLKSILGKDRLAEFKERGMQGDALAQYILGEIFFYGIDTNNEFWQSLDRLIALMCYSKNNHNFAIVCSCSKEPDYAEALTWYERAALSGISEAESRIEEFQNHVQVKKTNSVMLILNYKLQKV